MFVFFPLLTILQQSDLFKIERMSLVHTKLNIPVPDPITVTSLQVRKQSDIISLFLVHLAVTNKWHHGRISDKYCDALYECVHTASRPMMK